MEDLTIHIGLLTVSLFIPAAQSLKDKRRVLKSLKDRIRAGHNVSVSELDYHDKWQRAVLGVCSLGTEKSHLESCLGGILNLIGDVNELEIAEHRIEFI